MIPNHQPTLIATTPPDNYSHRTYNARRPEDQLPHSKAHSAEGKGLKVLRWDYCLQDDGATRIKLYRTRGLNPRVRPKGRSMGESYPFSPLDTPSVMGPPQEVGFSVKNKDIWQRTAISY